MKNKRKNIKMVRTKKSLKIIYSLDIMQVIREERLGSVTKTARAEEEERLARLARLQQEDLPGFDLLLIIIHLHLLAQIFSLKTCLVVFCISFRINHGYFQGGRG